MARQHKVEDKAMTRKSVYFFCQILLAGGIVSQSQSMTADEAQAHLQDLRQSNECVRAYMVNLDKAFV